MLDIKKIPLLFQHLQGEKNKIEIRDQKQSVSQSICLLHFSINHSVLISMSANSSVFTCVQK